VESKRLLNGKEVFDSQARIIGVCAAKKLTGIKMPGNERSCYFLSLEI
jgi:hypothetical protein